MTSVTTFRMVCKNHALDKSCHSARKDCKRLNQQEIKRELHKIHIEMSAIGCQDYQTNVRHEELP